ncbi:hypothetical protein SODG_004455 [Sodalis praecaptivus]
MNRASVKANEQIALLTELLEQQKQQTELLAKLTRGDPPNPASTPFPANLSCLRILSPNVNPPTRLTHAGL